MMSMSPDRSKRASQVPEVAGDYSAAPEPDRPALAAMSMVSPATVRKQIPVELAGMRLDSALAQLFPQHSRSRLQQWLKQGAIVVDNCECAPSSKVAGGEQVTLHTQVRPEELAWQAQAIALDLVYEDDAILVINKPAGLVVHPGHGNWSGTVLNALLQHLPQARALPRAGIVHRLDKETSGLMVIAKTLEAQTDLVKQLQARTVTRRYLAVVHGSPPASGRVDAPIGRHPTQRTKMAITPRGRSAITDYTLVEALGRYSLVELKLFTGRTHQIRVHMQSIGHPLLGDPTYGARRDGRSAASDSAAVSEFKRQALHAAELALQHPVTRVQLSWRTEAPRDMRALIDALRTAPTSR